MKKSTILKGVVIGLGAIGTVALGVFGAKKYKESKEKEVKEPQTPREALEIEAEKMAEEVCMADEEVETDEPKITKEVAIGGAVVAGVVGVGYLGYKAFKKFKGKDKECSSSDESIEIEDILYTGYDDSYIDDNTANNSVMEEGDATKDDVGGYNPHSEVKNIDIKDNTSDSFKK